MQLAVDATNEIGTIRQGESGVRLCTNPANVGLEFGTTVASKGRDAMNAVSQVAARAVAEDDDRGELDARGETRSVVLDDVVVEHGTDVDPGVGDEGVDRVPRTGTRGTATDG